MSNQVAQRAMEQTALKFGVSYEEVYREIERVIADARRTQNSILCDFMACRGELPTPEEVIIFISQLIGQ